MLKVDSLKNWRTVATGASMTYLGEGARTEVVKVRSSGHVQVLYTPMTADGEVFDDQTEYVGTLIGDDAVRLTSPGAFRLTFEFAKGVLCTIYDDREAFEAPSPDTEIFTVFEKRGLESLDPLDIIAHRVSVKERLTRMAQGPEHRDRDNLVASMQAQMDRMADALERLTGDRPDDEKKDSNVDINGDAEGA